MRLTEDLVKAGCLLAQMQALDGLECTYQILDLNAEEDFIFENMGYLKGICFNFQEALLPKIKKKGYIVSLSAVGKVTTIQGMDTESNLVEYWTFVS